MEALLEPYDSYIVSGDGMSSDVLAQEMSVILLIAAVVIVAVLLFTSKSYLEVLVFLIVFVVSALLNMGTNFIFGSISFITNSIAVVLQLALAIDYAIIFCHRYMEERELLDAREADMPWARSRWWRPCSFWPAMCPSRCFWWCAWAAPWARPSTGRP